MKTNTLLLYELVSLSAFGCKKHSTEQEIKTKINQLYSKKRVFYDNVPDTTLFSNSILKKIMNVQEITKDDIERIKKSKYPTDKPIILEGSWYTSLYEGFSKYTIKKIFIKDNTAEAVIEFEFNSRPKEIWTDDVILIHKNDWKINNIIFSNKYNGPRDLKAKLNIITDFTH